MTTDTIEKEEVLNEQASKVFNEASGSSGILGLLAQYGDIVDYATAEGEEKAEMEKRIASIDPKVLTTITRYAQESAEKVGNTADQVIEKAKTSDAFLGDYEKFVEQVKNFGFKEAKEIAKNYMAEKKREVAYTLSQLENSPLSRLIGKIVYFVTGLRREKNSLDEAVDQTDRSLLEIGTVMSNLDRASDQVPDVLTGLETLKGTFLQFYRDLGFDIGAAVERLRRIEEEEIPALKRNVGTSLEKQEELSSLYMSMTLLNRRITNLVKLHSSSILQLHRIRDLKTIVANAALGIDEKRHVSKHEWKGVLAVNLMAAKAAGITGTEAAANAFSRRIRQEGTTITGLLKEQARESLKNGEVDAVELISQLEQQMRDLANEAQALVDYNRQQKQEQADMIEAQGRLRELGAKIAAPVTDEEIAELKMLTYQPAEPAGAVTVEAPTEKQPVPVPGGHQ